MEFLPRKSWRVPVRSLESPFVRKTVGVEGNVCERAAVMGVRHFGNGEMDEKNLPAIDLR